MPDASTYPRSTSETEEWLKSGKPIEFPKERPEDVSETDWKTIRTISPDVLRSLFAEETREATVAVKLKNVIISGDLYLSYRYSKFEFSITDSDFDGFAGFSFFIFDGAADFLSSRFHQGAKFDSSRFAYDLRLSEAAFEKQASFQAIEVQGRLFSIGVRFENAHFANATFGKSALFKSQLGEGKPIVRTEFIGEAKFPDVRFEGTAEFDGAAFHGKADFSRTSFGGNANFKPAQFSEFDEATPVEFHGEALFRDVKIGGSGDFRAGQFHGQANFQRIKVGANLSCSVVKAKNGPHRALFQGPALFDGAQITGRVVFDGASFAARCSFESAHVGGNALFRGAREFGIPAHFGAEAFFLDFKVDGSADFGGTAFGGEANFRRMSIGGSVFFRTMEVAPDRGEPLPAEFHGKFLCDDLSVQGSLFCFGCWFGETSSFRRLQVGLNGFFGPVIANEQFVRTEFHEDAMFPDSRFGGGFNVTGVHSKGPFVLDRSEIGGAVYFGPAEHEGEFNVSSFEGGFYARDAEFGGRTDFSGARFRFEADFTRTKFGSGAFFSSVRRAAATLASSFSGKRLRLYRAEVDGDLEFEGVEFDCWVDCEAIHVKGNAIFRTLEVRDPDSPATQPLLTNFKRGGKFLDASIEGVADFSGATFAERAMFNRVKVGGPAFFRRLADLRANVVPAFQDASFAGAVFTGGADFDGVRIEKNVSFSEATFGASSRFSRMICSGEANFDLVEIDGTANFQRSQFKGPVTLRDARTGVVNFGASNQDVTSFLNGLNLQGFTYIRFVGNWEEIFRQLRNNHLEPYSQLEKSFRNTGNDRDADSVYLARHDVERRILKQKTSGSNGGNLSMRLRAVAKLFEDWALRCIFNYGVPSYRMVWTALVLVLIGIGLLCGSRALVLATKAEAVVKADTAMKSDIFLERRFPVRAFYGTVSFVDLLLHSSPESSLTRWKPSEQKPIQSWGPTYRQMTTVLSIAVYTSITLAAASLAGLIKRKQT